MNSDLPELRNHIRERRAALAGFLEDADLGLAGDLLRVIPRRDVYICYLNDNRALIGELASELYGRKLRVEVSLNGNGTSPRIPPALTPGAVSSNGSNPKPTPAFRPDWANIPFELKVLSQWVMWRYELRKDKWTKPPYQPDGTLASTTDPATWSSFDAVRAAYDIGEFDGIGFVLTANDPYTAFDFDHCLNESFEIVVPRVTDYVRRAGSYTEGTPSGTGLRILTRATLPPGGRKKGDFEVYKTKRYVTITGACFPAGARPIEIADRQAEVEAIHAEIFAERIAKRAAAEAGARANRTARTNNLDDDALLDKARRSKNGDRFSALYDRGDWKTLGFPSPSEADLALCSMLAFWCGADKARVDQLFRASGLNRPKWEGRTDYRERTLEAAIATCTETYESRNWQNNMNGGGSAKAKDSGEGEKHDSGNADGTYRGDGTGADGQQEAEPEWSEPIPLDVPLLPTVPTDTFPPSIGDMIDETAAATETPRELAFGMALGTLAAACQRKIEVRVKPGYIEPLSLWPIAPLNSGERKTAVLQRMTRPLTEWEREQASKMKAEIAKAMSERETALAQIQAMRTKAARLEPGSADFAEASEAIANLEVNLKEVPRAPRVWAQDVTPEKLGALMADHGEQMTIISDEGGIIEIMAGRYSRGIPNLDIFLQGHAGAPHRVDRGNRPPVLMQHPALTMALSPQPEVLHGLAANRDFRGRGLLARFVYLLGISTLGYRTGEPPCGSKSASPAYEACIQRLLAIKPPPESGALTIELSDDARTEWHAYFVAVEKDLRPDGRFEYMRDWAGKLPGMAARVAGLLHCAEHAFDDDPTASKLSLNTMKRSLDFAAVCERHALAAYDLMGADLALEAARKLWAWIERQRKVEFTFRGAFKALQGSYPRAADLEPAFEVLLERAYIANKQTAPRIGRPTRIYQVNPALTERWAKEGAQWTGERRAV